MHILIYEHISSGGLSGEALSAGVLSEGFAMLSTTVADFQSAGHCVTVILDSRLITYGVPLKAKNVLVVSSKEEAKKTLLKTANEVDATLVIAPESNQVLSSIVRQLKGTDSRSLNCSAEAIDKASNKANLQTFATKLGLPIPKTLLLNSTNNSQKITEKIESDLQFPVVLKPIDGTSCSGLSIVSNPRQIAVAINKINKVSTNEQFIVQQFVEGVPVSVSLISTGHQALPISLNKQVLILEAPEADSIYSGGEVPFESKLKEKAFYVAKKIVESIPGLKGYIGVDLVLTPDAAFIVDVNSRLTTSYVGLCKVAGFNIAQAILNAVLSSELPKGVTLSGYSCFSKIKLPKPRYSILPKIYKTPSIISPPFPLKEAENACALVEADEITLPRARRKLQEAKECLIQICQGSM